MRILNTLPLGGISSSGCRRHPHNKKEVIRDGSFPAPYNFSKVKSLNKAFPFSFQFDNGCHFIRRHAAEIDDTFFL